MRIIRRILLLTLCLLLAASPALAAGMRFSVQLSIDPAAFPGADQALLNGLTGLMKVTTLEGEFVCDGASFELDAALLMGEGKGASRTTCRIWGLDSHWGVRSSLLGDEELMVNCAALLPFGQKASNYLGIPLDAAALLMPYTHVNALSSITALIAPLFPAEDGKVTLTRAEMDALVNEISRLCDEDPALNLWLQTTGLYRTAKRYCSAYFSVPEFILPSLTVRRSGDSLTWKSGLLTILSISRKDGVTTCSFSLPALASGEATLQQKGDQITGSASIDLDGLEVTASASFPARLTTSTADIALSVDAASPILPDGQLRLRVAGQTHGNSVTLHLLHPDSSATLLTAQGTLIPLAAEDLPRYTPADLTGVNILSVNGDSLRALLNDIKWPLMSGLFDLVTAAPAPAVQALMDYAEDSGLIDLLTDALSGGSGY